MGLGLLLLTAGAFVRFVLGRYAGMLGAYDAPGAILMGLGVAAMLLATARHVLGTPYVVRSPAHADTAATGDASDDDRTTQPTADTR